MIAALRETPVSKSNSASSESSFLFRFSRLVQLTRGTFWLLNILFTGLKIIFKFHNRFFKFYLMCFIMTMIKSNSAIVSSSKIVADAVFNGIAVSRMCLLPFMVKPCFGCVRSYVFILGLREK